MDDLPSDTAADQTTAQAYQVVARRYRPQTFDELIGQEHVAGALKQAISTGRIGHAYLFTGARGVGKTSAARVLAKALNCTAGPTTEPCNECEVCRSITSGEDVDTIEIDAASNTGVDNIRDLRQNASVKASRCRFKIYIIDEVHMLSKSAFNALLKTLEEPPEHVKFVFATTEPDKIPITILSRCQRFDFAGIEATSIADRLKQIAAAEGVEIDDEALAVLSIRAAGSMRDSQSLLEQLLAVAGNKIAAEQVYTLLGIAPGERMGRLVEALVAREAATALANLDEAIAGGADVGQTIDQLLGYFRDVMAMVVGCDTDQLRFVLPSQYAQAAELGQKLGVHTVLAMIQVLDQTASRMRGSLHTRTLAEMALVRIAHLDDLDNLAEIAAELRWTTPPAQPEGVKKKVSPVAVLSTATTTAAQAGPTVTTPPAASHTSPPTQRIDPPTSSSPAGPVTLTSEAVKSAWSQLTSDMEGMLAGYASEAKSVGLANDGTMVVSFTDQFSKERCESPVNRTELERSLSGYLGTAIALKFELDRTAPATTPSKPAGSPKVVSRRQRQSEIAERPFVARAVELFAADIGKLKVTPPRDANRS